MWRPNLIILQPTPYCNINCEYCYLKSRTDRRMMSASVINAISEKIFPKMSVDATPSVVWHAGEPTVAPLSWYEYAYEKIGSVAPAGTTFSIQSNGIGLSDAWIRFLQTTATHVGLSIDGPQPFHDARRKAKNGSGTWSLAMDALHRLQASGMRPSIISVLHPKFLSAADDFYDFYRTNEITQASFSIDETEGAHLRSSFSDRDYKGEMICFLLNILERAWHDGYPLRIREVERIANVLTGTSTDNEQVHAWQVVVVAANGDITTFSPEFMEVTSIPHDNFCFGNILNDDFEAVVTSPLLELTQDEIYLGVDNCRSHCRYFEICGGGAPANKMSENHSLTSGETNFCRLSIQSAADALLAFLSRKHNAEGSFSYPLAKRDLHLSEGY